MKLFCFLLIMSASFSAYADYNCSTAAGDSLAITNSSSKGIGAKLQSQTVSDHYRKNHGIKVTSLESIIDPDTKKYATDEFENGFLFALNAPKSGDENIWSLEFTWADREKATASLVDLEGIEFKFEFECTSKKTN